jgi:hypothetical protein
MFTGLTLFTGLNISDVMDEESRADGKADGIKTKIEEINNVKSKFNQIVLKRVGELLVEEISKIMGVNALNPNKIVLLKLPNFFKAIFHFYNNDNLLFETSLLYVIYSLGCLDAEMRMIYERNVGFLESRKDELCGLRDLLRLNFDKERDFTCKFIITSSMQPLYALLENQIENLIVFGLFKIFEWLNVINAQVQSEISTYEQSFTKTLQLFQTVSPKT